MEDTTLEAHFNVRNTVDDIVQIVTVRMDVVPDVASVRSLVTRANPENPAKLIAGENLELIITARDQYGNELTELGRQPVLEVFYNDTTAGSLERYVPIRANQFSLAKSQGKAICNMFKMKTKSFIAVSLYAFKPSSAGLVCAAGAV